MPYSMNGLPWTAINFECELCIGKHAVAILIYKEHCSARNTQTSVSLRSHIVAERIWNVSFVLVILWK